MPKHEVKTASIQRLIHLYNVTRDPTPKFIEGFITRLIEELGAERTLSSGYHARLKGERERSEVLHELLKRRIRNRKYIGPETKTALCSHIDDIWEQHG